MRATETCAKCGAELLAGGRFCRRCGEPASLLNRGSVTEAETRVFQATDDPGARTKYHEQRPTGPSYLAPNENMASIDANSTDAELPRLKRHRILWATAILVLILLLFGVVVAVRWTRTPTSTAPITTIDGPPPVGVAPIPPLPKSGTQSQTGSVGALDYPGAEVTMEMTRAGEGGVRQLRTTDPFDKVVAWYTAKLPTSRTIKKSGSAVFTGESRTVVIKGDDVETTILLTEGIDQ